VVYVVSTTFTGLAAAEPEEDTTLTESEREKLAKRHESSARIGTVSRYLSQGNRGARLSRLRLEGFESDRVEFGRGD